MPTGSTWAASASRPTRAYLCTAAAKRPETISWADGRADLGVVPDLVWSDWGIDLDGMKGGDDESFSHQSFSR